MVFLSVIIIFITSIIIIIIIIIYIISHKCEIMFKVSSYSLVLLKVEGQSARKPSHGNFVNVSGWERIQTKSELVH